MENSGLTQYKQILVVVEYENQQEYEYHEFHHIYKNDFLILQQLLTRLKKDSKFLFLDTKHISPPPLMKI